MDANVSIIGQSLFPRTPRGRWACDLLVLTRPGPELFVHVPGWWDRSDDPRGKVCPEESAQLAVGLPPLILRRPDEVRIV